MPQAMIDTLSRDYDIEVMHGWGMTEMSPIGTLTILRPEERAMPPLERAALAASQGRRMFGVDLKIIDEKGNRAAPESGTPGELFVRGPTIVSGYYKNADASAKQIDAEGWFATGDVAKIAPGGWLMIVDRTKDLVKSGGEWISSIDVENAALGVQGRRQLRGDRRAAPQVDTSGRCWWWSRRRAPTRARPRSSKRWPAASPSGRCPTTSCSSTPCR